MQPFKAILEYSSTDSYSFISCLKLCLLGELNKCVVQTLPLCRLYTPLFKTFFQAYGSLTQTLSPGDLNKCVEASWCHWWMPFTRPSSEPMVLTQQAMSPGRTKQTCRGFLYQWLISFRRSFLSTTYWLRVCLPADALSLKRLEWMCRGFPASVMSALYKVIFQLSPSYWLNILCPPGYLNEHAKDSPVSLTNSIIGAIFQVQIKLTHRAQSPGRCSVS